MPVATETVIEELTITVSPDRRSAYLERDAEVWTPYLETCDGYLGKETWLPDDRPDTVVLVIRWASVRQWKAITADDVARVDDQMGDAVADTLTCRSYRVV